MSLNVLAQGIRGVVMGEFMKHCDGSPANVDPSMLAMLVSSYLGEDVEFPKTEIKPSKKEVSKRGRKPKTHKLEVPVEFKRMPDIEDGKCMARSYAKGFGTQCTRRHTDGSEYCKTHCKSLNADGIPPLGRIDRPRQRHRFDDPTREEKWKYFNGDGEVEICEVCEVCDDSVESDCGSDATEIMDVSMEEVTGVVNTLVDAVVEGDKEEAREVVEDNVTKEEDTPEVEENVTEDIQEVEENVAEDTREVEEKVTVDTPKVEENVTVDTPKVEDNIVIQEEEPNTLEEDKKDGDRNALIQGIKYIFKKSEEEEGYDIYRTDKENKKVGYYDGDDYIFAEEYQEIHDMKITDDDQDEVEWI